MGSMNMLPVIYLAVMEQCGNKTIMETTMALSVYL